MALSETFGRADVPAVLNPIHGYAAWHTDRSGADKGGGGLTMLYRDSLTAHQCSPSVPPHLEYIKQERQWLLVSNAKEKLAFLHVYISCYCTLSMVKTLEVGNLILSEAAKNISLYKQIQSHVACSHGHG